MCCFKKPAELFSGCAGVKFDSVVTLQRPQSRDIVPPPSSDEMLSHHGDLQLFSVKCMYVRINKD